MQTGHDVCQGIIESYCYGACEQKEVAEAYNERVQLAIESLQQQPSFAIIEKGLTPDEKSCVLVWKGKFYGMGSIPLDVQVTDPETLKDLVTRYKENSYILNLVNGYAGRFPGKVIQFEMVNGNQMIDSLDDR
jgi:DNA polymerase-3 subunit epsilon